MSSRRTLVPVLLAAAVGAVLWFAVTIFSGKREAWDSSAYWVVAYPASILTCAYLGYSYPERSWRWPVVLFEAQFLAMCVRNGELGNLWPLGMALFAVVALPGILAAKLAGRLGVGSRTGVAS